VRRLQHQSQETPDQVKRISHAVIFIPALFLVGCSWFGPAEEYKTESGRTTYRAAAENPATRADVTPAPQKIPGESR
jgi:hypothetical protein